MSIFSRLADLIVNIRVNNTDFFRGMNESRLGIMRLAATFYVLQRVFNTTIGGFNSIVDAAAKVEKGFLDIEKISNNLRGTTFRNDLIEMSKSLEGINITKLQEAGKEVARLGLRGEAQILGFTKNIALFSQTSGVAANQAALTIGRLITAFNFDDPIDASSRLSNAMVELAESMATSESELTVGLQRLSGIGQALGFNAQEIMAWTGAMKAIGQRSEIAASGFVRFTIALVKNTDQFVKSMKLSHEAGQILKDLIIDDPFTALKIALTELNKVSAPEFIRVMEEMEVSSVRTLPTIAALKENFDKLLKAQKAVNKGFGESSNIWLDHVAQAESLTAKVDSLANSWTLLKATLGDTAVFKGLIDQLRDVAEAIQAISGEAGGEIDKDLPIQKQIDALVKRNRTLHNWIKQLEMSYPEGLNAGWFGELFFGTTRKREELARNTETIRRLRKQLRAEIPEVPPIPKLPPPADLEKRLGIFNFFESQLEMLENRARGAGRGTAIFTPTFDMGKNTEFMKEQLKALKDRNKPQNFMGMTEAWKKNITDKEDDQRRKMIKHLEKQIDIEEKMLEELEKANAERLAAGLPAVGGAR